jgi:thiazole synthase
VLPYILDDPIACKQLEEEGCAAVMPLAAPIGSGLGVCNPYSIRIIKERANVPVIVDAGVGTASDAAIAMELGVDAILMNTGIAAAKEPVQMAEAMRYAVHAGRLAYLSGRMEKRLYANASSPMQNLISIDKT